MGQWQSFSHFLSMGGYGQYVWGAYGMIFFCLICQMIGLARRRSKAVREVMLEARAHQAEENLER
jgi:heme exporter protein D